MICGGDGGAGVIPSLMNGTQKLEAVQAAINRTKERRMKYWNAVTGTE